MAATDGRRLNRQTDRLAELLGPGGLLTGADVVLRAEGWGAPTPCQALAIARPATTAQVSAVLSFCQTENIAVVPYGGGTGLVQGAVAGPDELLLSLERMRRTPEIDPVARIATVDAGVTLQDLQQTADADDLLFPLDLGARGSATIGGNVSTNAGGNRVIRFGMMREMVLGLEAVLADGTVVSSMNRMLKNNAGYDLKQLFIGSEGTLGVVTRIILRLREKPVSQNLALVAAPGFPAILRMLKLADRALGGQLSAFEVMWREFYEIVTTPPARNAPPLAHGAPCYVLIESLGGNESADRQRFEEMLGVLFDERTVTDAVIADSRNRIDALWAIRDSVEELLHLGPTLMFDVSLPITAMESYVHDVRAQLDGRLAGSRCVVWGHVGDSNLHLWISHTVVNAEIRDCVESIVYGPLRDIGGSISAEHGIGVEKRRYLGLSRSGVEIAMMRALKSTLDPRGILNPGKVLD
ncbi:MAG TPA: FAD-binding oxidoreductase [Steroidobacteraceae bacterium]|nr:FAD-binding oxidoreductase [Steroidobacteraceae bacterium]